MIELTILMPCLNEERTIKTCIQKAQAYLSNSGIQGEVLVSDNGSTDDSVAIALSLGARVVHARQKGYGSALLAGIGAARGRFVIMGDADDSYDFSDLAGFVEELRSGSQLVMGNRFQGGIAAGAMPPLHRYLGNPVLSFIGRLLFRVPIRDFHCGLRGFERDAILSLGLVTPGMEFASEMVAKAAASRLRISEVPTTLRPDGRDRPPHLRTWRDGWRHLRFLLLFSPRWLFLYPGAALLLAGVTGFVLLQQGPLQLPGFGLDIHSLLYMAGATILGAQLIQMALLTKWVAISSGVVPPQRWLVRLEPYLTVENGLILGLGLFLFGLSWSLGMFLDWRESGFQALDPRQSMRWAIPAVTLMILGLQAATAALFAGALQFCWQSRTRELE